MQKGEVIDLLDQRLTELETEINIYRKHLSEYATQDYTPDFMISRAQYLKDLYARWQEVHMLIDRAFRK